jgi:hypothetical protein
MSSNELLHKSLKSFYSIKKNRISMLDVINNNGILSLRLIDWFITNYSKKNNVAYDIFKESNNIHTLTNTKLFVKRFNVYHSYKSQLKAYSKKRFDPFCRRDRINFSYMEGNKVNEISTTVGQLNFFKWAINNCVLKYINENKNIVEEDMNISLKNNKKNINCKRSELSKSISRGLNKNNQNTIIEFN